VMDKISGTLIQQGYLDETDKEKLRLAALLHDIGHYPFSHVLETVYVKRYGDRAKHDIVGAEIIRKTSIGKTISKAGFDPKEISSILEKRSAPLFSFLLSSDLDVDKIDYLLRDARNTGVSYGYVDVDRLLRTVTVDDAKARLAVLDKGKQAIENFLVSRYHMFSTVYYHKSVAAFELILKMLGNALLGESLPDLESILKMDELQYIHFDDYQVWTTIQRECHAGNKPKPFLRELAEMLCDHRPVKLVFEEPSLSAKESDKRKLILRLLTKKTQIKLLSKESGIEPDWILFAEPPPIEILLSKEPEETLLIEKEGEFIPLREDDTSIVHLLTQYTYVSPRVYTKDDSYKEKLRKAISECFGM
jgi:HD superfamily phosphohydrolase